jgi:hypothetical protein
MEKPIMKQHFITEQINCLERLVEVLHTHRSIYVRSWHKVHPTSFFHHSASFPVSKLKQMIAAGEFWCCERKKDVQSDRIRFQLLSIAESGQMIRQNTMNVDDVAAAMQEFGNVSGLTIAELAELAKKKPTDQ